MLTPDGDGTGAVLVDMRFIEFVIHSWDLAKASGQSTDLDHELAEWVPPPCASRRCLRGPAARAVRSASSRRQLVRIQATSWLRSWGAPCSPSRALLVRPLGMFQ